jgi:predicted ATPase
MIYKLDIKDPTKTPVKWLGNVEALKKPRAFEFKPGLNVLWGRNGSGKTTLTLLLARLFHCEQGNHPVVTRDSLDALAGSGFNARLPLEESLEVVHDGQGVRHFDPSHAVGLMGGGAAFDWDFGMEGITNQLFKGSAGQTTMFRFERILNEIIAEEVPEVDWKMKSGTVNDIWQERIDLAKRILKKNGKKGQPTVLLDEPERSYDLNAQAGTWKMIRAYAEDVQFIVASHSLFALQIPDANYIELSPGYLKASEGVLELLKRWPTEKSNKVPESVAKKVRDQLQKAKR